MGLIFNIGGASAYGLADPTIYDRSTPKMRAAIQTVAQPRPSLNEPNLVAGTTSLSTSTADIAHNIWGSFGASVGIGPLNWLNWTVNVTRPGNYAITTDLGTPPGQQILLDGVPIGGAAATLGAGLHGVRVRNLGSNGFTIASLNFTRQ